MFESNALNALALNENLIFGNEFLIYNDAKYVFLCGRGYRWLTFDTLGFFNS